MKNKIIISLSILLLVSSNLVFSEIYKCSVGGHITYQSDPCTDNEQNKTNQSSTFDGWDFGMHISAMKRRARERQLAISPGSNSYVTKYNQKHLNSKPEERKYTYKTNIMDKFTTVTLFFTQTTGKLYEIKTTFHVSQLKPEERKYFYESLFSNLSNKYGKPKNIQPENAIKGSKINPIGNLLARNLSNILVGTLFAWGLNTDNIVYLSYKKNYHTMSSYKLIYKNMPLVKQNESEVTYLIKKRTNKAISRDSNKL